MRIPRLPAAWRRVAPLALLTVPLLAACSQSGIHDGGRVPGKTLIVYSALPTPASGAGADIVAGEKLALQARGGRSGNYTIGFTSVPESPGAASRGDARVADRARDIISDTQVIAVIGGLRTAETRITAPLYNAAGIPQVVLGAGYVGFTERAAPGEPGRYAPAAGRTFARLVGDDADQASALAAAAVDPRPRTLTAAQAAAERGGSGTVAVEAEAGPANASLAAATRAAAARAGLRLVTRERDADTVILIGEDAADGQAIVRAIGREAPHARIVLPDALVRAGVADALPAAVRRRTALVSAAPPAPPGFAARFRAAYGRAPGPYAASGWAAMNAVLDAIGRAGARGAERRVVADALLSSRALGIDAAGDRPAAPFTILPGETRVG